MIQQISLRCMFFIKSSGPVLILHRQGWFSPLWKSQSRGQRQMRPDGLWHTAPLQKMWWTQGLLRLGHSRCEPPPSSSGRLPFAYSSLSRRPASRSQSRRPELGSLKKERGQYVTHTYICMSILDICWYFNNKYIIRTVWSFTDILSSDWAGFIIPSAIIGSQNLPTILIICPVVWLTLLPIPAIHQIGGNVQCVLLTKNFIFYDYTGLFWFISA